jgi:hypothetical protein
MDLSVLSRGVGRGGRVCLCGIGASVVSRRRSIHLMRAQCRVVVVGPSPDVALFFLTSLFFVAVKGSF